MIELFPGFTTAEVLEIGACCAEIAAVLYAAKTINKSSQQQLFHDRVDAYLLSKDLIETYKHYMKECDKYVSQNPAKDVDFSQRYKWLTHSQRFEDIEDAIDCNDIQQIDEIKKQVYYACAELNEKAEAIGLLWGRNKKYWFAQELKDFIRNYALLLQSLMRHQANSVKRNDIQSQINATQDRNIRAELSLKLAMYEDRMKKAEQSASEADDALGVLYEQHIIKHSKHQTQNKKPEKALIAMKDDIRL